MENSKKKIARNYAIVEFLANVEDVISMLDKGYNKKNVYNYLIEKNCIEMSYRSFCWNIQRYTKNFKQKNVYKSSKKINETTRKKGFGQLEDIDVDSLF